MIKKESKILTAILLCSLILFLNLSGCLGEQNNIETNNNQNTNNNQKINLLNDSGFENLSLGYWDVAGYQTQNVKPIYYDGNLQGVIIENTTFGYDKQIKYSGATSAFINSNDKFNITVISNWNQNIYEIPYGKDLELSCWIKTKDAEEVILMVQCWDSEELSLKHLLDESTQTSKSYYDKINGTNNWEKYTIKLVNVPDEAKVITVRLGLIGTGIAWFDDVELYAI